ncbi:MAG: radical SAM protein [Thermoflexales bacterium]|nr:radical SAM protein [Thermoflexales bacterium]
MIAFGPIPSRRLGRSLGVNNIPPKFCTYSCIYCQLGRTLQMQVKREAFYAPEKIFQDVREQADKSRAAGERIDYLTFVPDGEPTLDVNLGREIALLRPLGLPIAVITNGSLLWRKDVRADLRQADWVSVKVDAVQEQTWRRVNRPHGRLRLPTVLEGVLWFAAEFRGRLVTETMLVAGLNDGAAELEAVAEFLTRLRPSTAYIAIPTRPPAGEWVRPPSEEAITRAYAIFREAVERVELLTGYEGDAFAFTGDAEQDLLSITAVHPMREEALVDFLNRAGADWSLVQRLIAQGRLVKTEYEGQKFYKGKDSLKASSSQQVGLAIIRKQKRAGAKPGPAIGSAGWTNGPYSQEHVPASTHQQSISQHPVGQ